jgi:hypothetical protein
MIRRNAQLREVADTAGLGNVSFWDARPSQPIWAKLLPCSSTRIRDSVAEAEVLEGNSRISHRDFCASSAFERPIFDNKQILRG